MNSSDWVRSVIDRPGFTYPLSPDTCSSISLAEIAVPLGAPMMLYDSPDGNQGSEKAIEPKSSTCGGKNLYLSDIPLRLKKRSCKASATPSKSIKGQQYCCKQLISIISNHQSPLTPPCLADLHHGTTPSHIGQIRAHGSRKHGLACLAFADGHGNGGNHVMR